MPITIETVAYEFDALSDSAKDKAREWFRADYEPDYDFDDIVTIASLMGIDINQAKSSSGHAIYFSGFSSQGDGACFESTYEYKKGALAALREYCPNETEVLSIAKGLQDLQRRNFYRLQAATFQRGFYYHSGCMNVQVANTRTQWGECDEATETEMTELLRAFANWIYKQLNNEYDYSMSDEHVDECITANGYLFEETGRFISGHNA